MGEALATSMTTKGGSVRISPIIQLPGMAVRFRQEGNQVGVECAGEVHKDMALGPMNKAEVAIRFAADDTPLYDFKINDRLIFTKSGPRLGLLDPPVSIVCQWPDATK